MHTASRRTAFATALAYLLAGGILLLVLALLLSLFSHLGSALVPATAPLATKTIIVDAGHGGVDGGAESITGALEKDLNLSLARTYATLLRVCGYNVIETRTTDAMLDTGSTGGSRKTRDLAARLAFSRKNPDALFISIHMNKFPLAKYSGLQVYYGENNQKSKQLADTLQSMTRLYLQKDNTREPKRSTSAIYLLHRMDGVGILVECGFLSNPEEAARLDDPAYRQCLAVLLLCATNEYVATCGETP